jgi:two-component system response regulator
MKTNGNKILLVENDPYDVESTLRAFARSHLADEIVAVRDGAEALDYLFLSGPYSTREPRSMPAVVLLDFQLPKMEGLEVLRRLKADERTRRVPVVVLTSSAEQRDIVRACDIGASSFVRKPVDFDQFVAAAAHLGLYRLILNELPSR